MPPATFVILLLVVVLAVLGLSIICGALGAGRGAACPNPDCRHRNPPTARYCARCGGELPPGSERSHP